MIPTTRIIFSLYILFMAASCALGQTEYELESKYGRPHKVYKVSESICLIPQYGKDGQLLKAILYYNQIDLSESTSGVFSGHALPWDELQKILIDILPKSTRGRMIKISTTLEPVRSTTYKYENVEVHFTSFSEEKNLQVDLSTQLQEKHIAPPNNAARLPTFSDSSDDFLVDAIRSVEFVQIFWIHRPLSPK